MPNDLGERDEEEEGTVGPERPKRALSPHYRANDQGGYGNPPVAHQFAKHNPGGPGRPKGQTTLDAAMRKVLRRTVPVTRDGKSMRLNAADVLAERVLEAILSRSNSPAMFEYGRRIFAQYGPQPLEDPTGDKADYSDFSDDELGILGGFLARALGLPPPQPTTDVFNTTHDPVPVGEFIVGRRADQHMEVRRIEEFPKPPERP